MALKVEKSKIEAVIYTQQYRIEGEVYVPKSSRFTDFMSAETKHGFIPVTNGKVYSLPKDKLLHTVPLMNVNKSFVVIAFPKNLEGV